MPFLLCERVYMHNTFIKYRKSYVKIPRKLREKFPNRHVPSASIIKKKNLAKKFRQVNNNFIRRCQQCVENNEGYLQHHLRAK